MKGCKKKQINIGKGEIRFDEERKSVFDILKNTNVRFQTDEKRLSNRLSNILGFNFRDNFQKHFLFSKNVAS